MVTSPSFGKASRISLYKLTLSPDERLLPILSAPGMVPVCLQRSLFGCHQIDVKAHSSKNIIHGGVWSSTRRMGWGGSWGLRRGTQGLPMSSSLQKCHQELAVFLPPHTTPMLPQMSQTQHRCRNGPGSWDEPNL